MSSPCLLHMKFPRCVVERISMKYDRNLGAFGTKERNEIWAEVGRNSGLRQRLCKLWTISEANGSEIPVRGVAFPVRHLI